MRYNQVMARPALFVTAKTLEGLALCLWLGGMLAVGAFVAPIAFGWLERADAGRVMGETFRRLNAAGIVCGGVLLLALILEGIAAPAGAAWLRAARAALVGAALLLSLYMALSLFPAMESARTADAAASERFAAMHALSRHLLTLQLFLLACALIASVAGHAAGVRRRPPSVEKQTNAFTER